jgi:hypothetical protein
MMDTHVRDNTLYLFETRLGGRVSSTGSASGSRFSSVKDSTGQYTVTFDSAFAATPVVLVTASGGSANLAGIITAVTASAFTVQIRNTSSTLTDSDFHFVAVAVE